MPDVVVIGGTFRELLVKGGRVVRRVGGSGFVAALTAARLGAEVALVSFVGERDAQSALGALRRAGVDTSAVTVLPGISGVFALSDLADHRAPRPGYRPAEAVPQLEAWGDGIPTAGVVLAFGFPDFDSLPLVAAAVRERGTVMWDRQGWLSRNVDRLAFAELPVDERVYVANLEEMRADANRPTYAEALSDQPAAGFDSALIKCGRWGTVVITEEVVEFIPAFIASVTSSIGSGDCFAGAVAARLAGGQPLGEAAKSGAAAASLFVERESNSPPKTLPDAVEAVFAERARRAVNPAALERVLVYLAGPWFTAAEALLIEQLEASLDNLGVHALSPGRDIGELSPDPSPAQVLEIGRSDYAAIDECDLVVAVLDGSDPGTLMEVGYAARAGKPIIGLNSLPDVIPQPMREAAGVRLVGTVPALLDEVTLWTRENLGLG